MEASDRQFFELSAKSEEISGGPSCGTKYSLDHACKFCGSGAIPIGNRVVKNIPHGLGRIFFTDDHELIVDDRLGIALQAIGIDTLAHVVDLQSNVLPFYELRPEVTLPPFSKLTTGYEVEDQCIYCKRDGFFHIPRVDFKLIYENIDPIFFNYNVLVTYELFGTSWINEPFSDCAFASPKFIVSNKVAAVLKSESIKPISFEPVILHADRS